MEIMIAFSSSNPRTKVAVYLCAALFIALNSSPTNGRIEKNSAQRNNSRLLQAVNTHGAKKLLPDDISAVLLKSNIRSEERRVGKECIRTCSDLWSPYP